MVAARLPDFFEDVFPMQDEKSLPFPALLGLGATQILGYGTLYYAFSILVPDIARDFRHSEEWVFGAFSASLLIGGLAAPFSGRLADRFGGARIMGWGSVASALALAATAMAPGAACFVACLVLMQLVSSTVLYATAFTTIVQAGGLRAQTSIVHLTLFAGFASTLFWPLTSWAHGFLGWREIYLAFGAVNLFVCAPIHFALLRLPVHVGARRTGEGQRDDFQGLVAPDRRKRVAFLMMAGFAIEGYALSAMLVHVVPLTQSLGLGKSGLVIASLFGPAQVASRLINLLFGGALRQTTLAVLSAVFMPLGMIVLILTAPSLPGAVVFAIGMGLGSGLTSIVSGTLPLELFGREGYGKLMGWGTFARQLPAAMAPFAMSLSLANLGTLPSLGIIVGIAFAGAIAFAVIPVSQGKKTGTACGGTGP